MSTVSSALSPRKSLDDGRNRLGSLLDRYAEFAARAGKRVRRSPPEETRRLLAAMSEEKLRRTIERLERELAIFAEATAAGESLSDSARLLWRCFSRMGFTPCADIFGRIGDTDIVEVYGLDQTHLFQSLNLFDWVSYSIERALCEPWYQLTRRSPEIERDLSAIVQRLLAGEVKETIRPDVPRHLIEEQGTELMLRCRLRIKYLSPVHARGELVAIVAVNDCLPDVS